MQKRLRYKVSFFFVLQLVLFIATSCSKEDNNKITIVKELNKNYFTQDKSKKAFSHQIKGLTNDEIDKFILGKSFFSIPWVEAPSATTARDGLGPLYSANTCKHCHPNNGAGVALNKDKKMSRSLLLRLSHKHSKNGFIKLGFEIDSVYGGQLSRNGNQKVKAEGKGVVTYTEIKGLYFDGTAYRLRKPTYEIKNLGYGELDSDTIFAPRIALALIGLGQIELISEKDILANEDKDDKNGDGISGKANYSYDPNTNSIKLGRFTWKASATSIKHQTAGAAHNDMGLSNPFFPSHNCTVKQIGCINEAKKSVGLDLPMHRLDAITYYISNLAIPKQREVKKHIDGKNIFSTLGCIGCHTPSFTTSLGVKIEPYSDFLLHNMGKELSDGRSEFLALGDEWRTAPLWGIGLYKKVSGEANYLHDGRARSIEEAILWHNGEAQKSKNKFMALDKISREKVLLFLKSI